MELITDTWAIIATGSAKYIGQIEQYIQEGFLAGWVKLNPCYEYISQPQLQQMGQNGIGYRGRVKFILPHEHLMNPTQVLLKPNEITFLSDMAEKDRQEYEQMIAQVEQQVELSRIQKETGIVTASALPKP
jgi:hypothetical protein